MRECYWVCVCDSACVCKINLVIWQTKGLQVVSFVVQLIDETSSGQWSINIAHTKKLNFTIQGTHKVLHFSVPIVFGFIYETPYFMHSWFHPWSLNFNMPIACHLQKKSVFLCVFVSCLVVLDWVLFRFNTWMYKSIQWRFDEWTFHQHSLHKILNNIETWLWTKY